MDFRKWRTGYRMTRGRGINKTRHVKLIRVRKNIRNIILVRLHYILTTLLFFQRIMQ